jgi:membrane protease YdiL (CAAX protease family)
LLTVGSIDITIERIVTETSARQMDIRHDHGSRRRDALLPAFVIVAPYFLNKLIYIEFPGYTIFVATDYACRIFSLVVLYLLLRNKPASFPIPWRLAVPSAKELMTALVGTITLIGASVVGATFLGHLNANSWQLTTPPSPVNVAVQYFDGTVGMVLVGLSEEVVFRFYLVNLLLLQNMSPATAIIVSSLIFGGIHWSYGAGAVAFATLAGLILSTIYFSARNLTVPIIAHAAFDAFYFGGGVAFLLEFPWQSSA